MYFRDQLYNPKESADYIVNEFDDYHCMRIATAIRTPWDFQKYVKEMVKKQVVPARDICPISIGVFSVKSQTNPDMSYIVDTETRSCSCPAGVSGSKCKHLLGVHIHTATNLYMFPPISVQEKTLYHEIAFGKPPSNPDYYKHTTKEHQISLNASATNFVNPFADTGLTSTNTEGVSAILASTSIAEPPDQVYVHGGSSYQPSQQDYPWETLKENIMKTVESILNKICEEQNQEALQGIKDVIHILETKCLKSSSVLVNVIFQLKKIANKRNRKRAKIPLTNKMMTRIKSSKRNRNGTMKK